MDIKTLNLASSPLLPFRNPTQTAIVRFSSLLPSVSTSSSLRLRTTANRRFRLFCLTPVEQNLVEKSNLVTEHNNENHGIVEFSSSCSSVDEIDDSLETKNFSEENVEIVDSVIDKEFDASGNSIWKQLEEIVLFAGPATGLWICGPLMSLIDTAIVGQGSSLELAALGPATVVCDYLSYMFMFLSIATSNMIATSVVSEDKGETQHKISILLFVGFTCGVGMLLLTKFLGAWILTAFTGTKNLQIVPAANTYVQIRGLAWPAILVGWVAQSASLGLKDSWGPLKALAVASVVNGVGDVVLCCFLGYGIAGAAWATMASQVVAAFMMINALNMKEFNAYSVSVPSPKELLQIIELAAPVFITMITKVAFYTFLTYFATSMGTHTVAAHQVMIQVFCMCTVWGEPLAQTAQSFMPELVYGANKSLKKAQMLLKSLLIVGVITGTVLGVVGTFVPLLCPNIFTSDLEIIGQMRKVLLPFFVALSVTPSAHCVEGSLMAGQELRFLSLSMSGCFTLGGLLVLLLSNGGCGLPGCWWALAGFQWARFFLGLWRLSSPTGFLHSDELSQPQLVKLKAT